MNKLFSSKYGWIALLTLLVAINFAAAAFHSRIDLTEEKRYTLSAPTKKLLAGLDDDVVIDFFLQGNLTAGVKKLSNSTTELLQEFQEYSHGRVRFRHFDPLSDLDDTAQAGFLDSLRRIGIEPNTQVAQSKKGDEQTQRIIIPGAIIKYKDRIFPVDLLKGVQRSREGQPKEQLYTNAETLLEYKFANAIEKVSRNRKPAVGYVMGNGEPLDFTVYDLIRDIRSNYRFGIVQLDSVPLVDTQYNALVIVKPAEKFSDAEKLRLDQYLMHGGNIIWMVDNLHAEMDSLRMDKETVAYDRGLNLEDLFFKYGIRVNQDLVEDMQCATINFVVGMQGDKPQIEPLPWPYFPLLNGSLTHPVSKNLDPVYSKFANSLDTAVKSEGITKTVLLQGSKNGRTISTPALISFESVKTVDDPKLFSKTDIPVAVLLEGRFNSLYANRIPTAVADSLADFYHQPFLNAGRQTARVIVCGDADIVLNEVSRQGPLPMGFDKDISYGFANQEFIRNALDYMLNPSGILETRSKDFTLRLLDPKKIETDRSFWQFLNIVLPVLTVIGCGFLFQALRKRKYQG